MAFHGGGWCSLHAADDRPEPRCRADPNQGYHIFLATGLRRGDADPEHEEQDLVTRDFALSEVERMIRDGEIMDATTVAALGLLRLKGLL
jgi:ADP-ribose pyrophosphatase